MKVLITGANGFVGIHLTQHLRSQNYEIIPITRKEIGNIDAQTNWLDKLQNIDCVIHLANRAHVMKTEANAESLFEEINVNAFQKLIIDCEKSNVSQLIYLSSIKVNGEITTDKPFNANDIPNPKGAYAISKLKAEKLLQNSQLNWTIIRPPLIYGKGVKGNFKVLMKLINKNIPLPLANINNKRSLLSIENLVDLITLCIGNKKAYQQIFLASDNKDISTTELIKTIAKKNQKSPTLFKFPLLKLLTTIIGKKTQYNRLTQSLQLDISKTISILNWKPK
ncbi:UDP-glucose 4-epimerase [hydrothermal vent metagenome]|uniref:UDP-glucose 4-epimerase n=1 Tax=hydrothermal vent metagenome TaxID=652676 RepID=A0A1W1CDI8_9ZZZZ